MAAQLFILLIKDEILRFVFRGGEEEMDKTRVVAQLLLWQEEVYL